MIGSRIIYVLVPTEPSIPTYVCMGPGKIVTVKSKGSLLNFSRDEILVNKNQSFPRTLVYLKKEWFESYTGTEMAIFNNCYISEIFNNFCEINSLNTDASYASEEVK